MEEPEEFKAQEYIEERHSVTMKINAKGQYSAECKCYGLTPDDAMNRASKITAILEMIIKEKNKGE
jgi:hypothetical protein